jgi:hypothetical protein
MSCGQCFDGKAAVPLLKPLPPAKKLLADKADDCTAFRDWLARRGTTPVIPNKINRRPFPITSAPIVIATRSRACSAASRTHAASLPAMAKAPELPQRRLLDRRHLLLVKLSLDPN